MDEGRWVMHVRTDSCGVGRGCHATAVTAVGIIGWASEGQVQGCTVLGLRETAGEGGIGPHAHGGPIRCAVGWLRRSAGAGEGCMRRGRFKQQY